VGNTYPERSLRVSGPAQTLETLDSNPTPNWRSWSSVFWKYAWEESTTRRNPIAPISSVFHLPTRISEPFLLYSTHQAVTPSWSIAEQCWLPCNLRKATLPGVPTSSSFTWPAALTEMSILSFFYVITTGTAMSDPGDFLGSAEGEVSLFRSIMRTRPVGIHRHVHILAMHNSIRQ